MRYPIIRIWVLLCLLFVVLNVNAENSKDTPFKQPVVVIGDRAFAPYSFLSDDGTPTGFCVDIAEAVFKEINIDYRIELRGWTKCIYQVTSGNADMLCAILNLPLRATQFELTKPICNYYPIAVCSKTRKSFHRDSLRSLNVLMPEDYSVEDLLKRSVKKDNVEYVDNIYDAISMVNQNKYDIAIANINTATYYIKEKKLSNVDFLQLDLGVLKMCFGIKKGNMALLDTLNVGLQRIKQKGLYDRIYNKWFGVQPEVSSISGLSLGIFSVVCALLLVLTVFIIILRIKVDKVKLTLSNSYKKELMELKQTSTIMGALPVGVAIYDKNGQQTYINDALIQIFGVNDPIEHLKRHVNILDDPLIPESIKKEIKKHHDVDCCLTYDINLSNKYKYYTSNFDRVLYLDCSVRFVKNDLDQVESMVLLVHDITNLWDQTKETENQRDQLQLALSASSLNVWEYSPGNNKVIELFDKNFEYKPIEIPYNEFLETICPDDLHLFLEVWDDIISLHSNHARCTVRTLNRNNHKFEYTTIDMKGRYDENGVLEKVIGVDRNVHKDFIREEDVHKAFSALRLAVNRPELEIFNFNLDDFSLSKFKNSRFEKMDFSIRELLRYVHVDDIRKLREEFTISCNDETSDHKVVIRAKATLAQADYEYFEIYFSVLKDVEDNPSSLLISMHNITMMQSTIIQQRELLDAFQIAMDTGHTIPWSYDLATRCYSLLSKDSKAAQLFDAKNNYHLIQPDDLRDILALFNDLMAKKIDRGTVLLRIWDDELGDYRVTEQSVKSIFNKNGEVVTIIGASKDLTDFNNLKIQRDERSAILNLIYKNLKADISVFDVDGILQETNFIRLKNLNFDSEAMRNAIGTMSVFDGDNLTEDEKESLRQGNDLHKIVHYTVVVPNESSGEETCIKKYVDDCYFLVLRDANGKHIGYIVIANDITNIITEKEEVERIKLQYETMFNSLHAGISIRDTKGNLIRCNPWYAKILGISRNDSSEYIVKHDLFYNSILSLVQEAMQNREMVARVLPLNFDDIVNEDPMITTRKGIVYFDCRISPLVNKEGGVEGTVSMIHDITLQVNSEKQVEEERLKKDFAIRESHIMAWTFDVNLQRFTFISSTKDKKKIFMSIDEVSSMIYPQNNDDVNKILNDMSLGICKALSLDTMRVRLPNSNYWRDISMSMMPFKYDSTGKCIEYMGYWKDNSHIVALHERIDQYGKRLRFVLEKSKICSWEFNPDNCKCRMFNPDKHCKDEMYYCNERYIEENYSPATLADVKYGVEKMCNRIDDDILFLCEKKIEGKWHYYLVNGMAVRNTNNEIMKYYGFSRKVTNIIARQRTFTQEKARWINESKLKSNFVANVSLGLQGYLQSFRQVPESLLAIIREHPHEYMGLWMRNVNLLDCTLHELWFLAKVDINDYPSNITKFDLKTILKNSWEEVTSMYQYTDYELQTDCRLEDNCMMHNDISVINLIVMNLAKIGLLYANNRIAYMNCENFDESYVKLSVCGLDCPINPNELKNLNNRKLSNLKHNYNNGSAFYITKAIAAQAQSYVEFVADDNKIVEVRVFIPHYI